MCGSNTFFQILKQLNNRLSYYLCLYSEREILNKYSNSSQNMVSKILIYFQCANQFCSIRIRFEHDYCMVIEHILRHQFIDWCLYSSSIHIYIVNIDPVFERIHCNIFSLAFGYVIKSKRSGPRLRVTMPLPYAIKHYGRKLVFLCKSAAFFICKQTVQKYYIFV